MNYPYFNSQKNLDVARDLILAKRQEINRDHQIFI